MTEYFFRTWDAPLVGGLGLDVIQAGWHPHMLPWHNLHGRLCIGLMDRSVRLTPIAFWGVF